MEFFNDRVDEIPAFLYTIDTNLNKVFLNKTFLLKPNHECCLRVFAEKHDESEFAK